jgi:hypothetical protein
MSFISIKLIRPTKHLIKQLLQRAQQRMKSQADKNRSERSFEVVAWTHGVVETTTSFAVVGG